jgi:CrcB protein
MTSAAALPANFAAVGLGAALGAWCRWGLGLWLNPLFAALPLGTLAANLAGGYLIGLALGLFGAAPAAAIPPALKLFAVTGFLGGLTTFSSFSAEAVERLMAGQTGTAFLLIGLHGAGSLLMTFLGFLSARLL